MPPVRTGATIRLGKEEMTRLIQGASVLGTGGGGSFSMARALVDDLADRGMMVELLDCAQLKPGALGVSTVVLGGGLTHAALEAMAMISDAPASWRAARELEQYLGRAIDFVFPVEIGPQNTMEAVRLAGFLGVPLVDGDCAGRAVPEMHQTTLSLLGIPLTPYVVATFQGDTLILPQVASEARNEALCRALAMSSGGVICVTGFPVEAERLREALIPGTLRHCLEIGALIHAGHQPAARIAAHLGGQVAFRGLVRHFEVVCVGGFFEGSLELEGMAPFQGEAYRIGIQNEFMWSWRGDSLDIRCPDLVCVLATDSGIGKVTYGHGFENAITLGEDLTVLHVPCHGIWQTALGRAVFPEPPSHALRTRSQETSRC